MNLCIKQRLRLRSFFGVILNFASALDHFSASSKSLIVNGKVPKDIGDKIAIYVAHNDFHGDKWENNLFSKIKAEGFTLITVINRENLLNTQQGSLAFERFNRGFDIAACRDVLNLLQFTPKELLLVNSSTAWNLGKNSLISKTRELSKSMDLEVIYATQSFQTKEHGQSFYIFAVGSGVQKLMNDIARARNWRTKRATVFFGEIQAFQRLKNKGVKIGFVFPYRELLKKYSSLESKDPKTSLKIKYNFPVNPSQDFWKLLMLSGAQFVKRNLVATNPGKLLNAPKSCEDAFKSAYVSK